MTITTVILLKENSQDSHLINMYYLTPLKDKGIPIENIMVLPLLYDCNNKISTKLGQAYLDKLLLKIPDTVTQLLIADAPYFKIITKTANIKAIYGKILAGKYTGYNKYNCVYVPNFRSIFKQPDNEDIIKISIEAFTQTQAKIKIEYAELGFNHNSDNILLDQLFNYPELAVDIETTGLSLDASIVSIAFAWDKGKGIAIDLSITGTYYLKKFFEEYTGRLIFHNALFDVKLLIRKLWMDFPTDFEGMNEGLKYFNNVDDTLLLAYLEKNSTTHSGLGLKELALEFLGNYAVDITNISTLTKKQILQYNLLDTFATYYLWEKYQHHINSEAYTVIFKPSIIVLIKCMLVGLPLDNERVIECNNILAAKENILKEQIAISPIIVEFNKKLRINTCLAKNATLKKIQKTVDDFNNLSFNSGSGNHLITLFFEQLKFPILDRTKTGLPTTGAETLADLRNHTKDTEIIELIDNIIELEDIKKIRNTFISALSKEKNFLHGSLKLASTQSGRLSSCEPNLQNLPSKGAMGKLIKSCFKAPKDWLFCGADFASLEERIGAILSNDPERIKIYSEGFDGHSIRALKYFPEKMPDIVEQVNKAETATKFWINEKGEYCCK